MLVNPPLAVSGLTADDRTELAATITAALLEGPGLPLKLAPTTMTGSGGVDQVITVPLPIGFTPIIGRKYRIGGMLFVRNGATLVAELAYEHHVLKRGSGAWSEVRSGSADPKLEAGYTTYFAADEHLPTLGNVTGTLTVEGRPINGQTVTVEFDGLLADYGTD